MKKGKELIKEIVTYVITMLIILLLCLSGIITIPGFNREDEHTPIQYEAPFL